MDSPRWASSSRSPKMAPPGGSRDERARAADDQEQFGKRLAGELTLIATLQNSPVGFASLRGADHIDMLYVHPSAAGQGVASMLCDALEKLAGGGGAKGP